MWIIRRGEGPVIATAIHAGHAIRQEIEPYLAISPADRRREEDPYTDLWVDVAPTVVVGVTSRFEYDLNRPPDLAVYQKPEHSWGLKVWREIPPAPALQRSLDAHSRFYREFGELVSSRIKRHGACFILDFHSYNHRRQGPDSGDFADPQKNPEINLGTETCDRTTFGPAIDRFRQELESFTFVGRKLDVRENVNFGGYELAQWTHRHFPGRACAISIEVKKFFMNEWTGVAESEHVLAIRDAFHSVVPGASEETLKIGKRFLSV